MAWDHTDSIFGVVDILPTAESDMPDYRNKVLIHSDHGSGIIIPREGGGVRVHHQLADADADADAVLDKATEHIDMRRHSPEGILQVRPGQAFPAFLYLDVPAQKGRTEDARAVYINCTTRLDHVVDSLRQ